MADEVFSVGFKVDSSGVEGDAEAAGKLAKSGFEKGFGALEIKPKISTTEIAKAFQTAAASLQPRDEHGRFAAKIAEGAVAAGKAVGKLAEDTETYSGKINEALDKISPREGGGHAERIAKGSEVAAKALGTLRVGFEGLAGLMAGGSFASSVRNLEEFSKSATETAKAGDLIGSSFEKHLPTIAAAGASLLTAATSGYEMAKSGMESRLELESLSKAAGVTSESMVKLRGMFKGSGVDLDEFDRGTANLATRMQQARAQIQKRVAEEPLDIADAQDAVTLARVKSAVTRVTAGARDAIAAQQGPLDVVKATLGLDEATQAQQQHADEAGHAIIAARARAAVEAATGQARDTLDEQRVNLGVATAQAAQASHAEQIPITIAGARLGVQQAEAGVAIQQIQGPLTVEGAQITAEGASIQAERAGMRYRRFAFGEAPDPMRVMQLNQAAARQSYDAAEFSAKQAKANVEKAEIGEETGGAAAQQALIQAIQGLRDAFRLAQLQPREDAQRLAEARLRQQELQAERGAGAGWQDRLSKANEDQVHLQSQLVTQSHEDAVHIQEAILGVQAARANLAGQQAGVGAGGGAAGGLSAEDQQRAADRGVTRAGLTLQALPQQQIGPLAGSILTGQGPDLAGADEGLLLPALIQAGQQYGGGLPGTYAALAALSQREPNNPALQTLLRQLYPRMNPLDRPNIGTRLGRLGPAGVLAGQAAPLDEGGRRLTDPAELKKAEENEEQKAKLQEAQRLNSLKAADQLGDVINAVTGGLANVVGGGGPGAEMLGGAALTGGGIWAGSKLLRGLFGRGAGAAVGVGASALAGGELGAEAGTTLGPLGIILGGLLGLGVGAGAGYLLGGGKPDERGPGGGKPQEGGILGGLASAGQALNGAAQALNSSAQALSGAAQALSGAASSKGADSGGKSADGGGGGGKGADASGNAPLTAVEQAEGGLISGSGDDTSDTIPMWASPHEYVIKASSVRRLGVPLLDRLNAGFASGGLVQGFQGGGFLATTKEAVRLYVGHLRGTLSPQEEAEWAEAMKAFRGEAGPTRASGPTQAMIDGKPTRVVWGPSGRLVAADDASAHEAAPAPVDWSKLHEIAPGAARTEDQAAFDEKSKRWAEQARISSKPPEERGPAPTPLSGGPRIDLRSPEEKASLLLPYDLPATAGERGPELAGAPPVVDLAAPYRVRMKIDGITTFRPMTPREFGALQGTSPTTITAQAPASVLARWRQTPEARAYYLANAAQGGEEGPELRMGPASESAGFRRASEELAQRALGLSADDRERYDEFALNRLARGHDAPSVEEYRHSVQAPQRPFVVAPEEREEPLISYDRPRHERHRREGVEAGGLYAMGGLIPARVSNGEYRMGAGAVSRLGLGFMHALNAGRFQHGGPVGSTFGYVPTPSAFSAQQWAEGQAEAFQVLAAIRPGSDYASRYGGFGNMGLTSFGGLPSNVTAGVPPGGGAISEHTLNLITSGGTFAVSATGDTVAAIQASAIGSRLTTTGQKPSWY